MYAAQHVSLDEVLTHIDAPAIPHPISVRACNVTLSVADLERAVAFYCGALGFHLRLRVADLRCEVELPGMIVCLERGRESSWRRSDGCTIGLAVENLDTALGRLRELGIVDLASIRQDGDVRTLTLTDPDGNHLYLCEVERGPSMHR